MTTPKQAFINADPTYQQLYQNYCSANDALSSLNSKCLDATYAIQRLLIARDLVDNARQSAEHCDTTESNQLEALTGNCSDSWNSALFATYQLLSELIFTNCEAIALHRQAIPPAEQNRSQALELLNITSRQLGEQFDNLPS
jgi:hypothetical protein